jgi:hypothetical protein
VNLIEIIVAGHPIWFHARILDNPSVEKDMNTLIISLSGIFAVLAVAFGLLLLHAIVRNLQEARRYRQDIKARLSTLRLSRMLKRHDIDQDAYLHTQPVMEIERQMRRCTSCSQTAHCDDVLEEDGAPDTSFCDNDEALRETKRNLEAA